MDVSDRTISINSSEPIGSGSFGAVRKGDENGKKVAIKSFFDETQYDHEVYIYGVIHDICANKDNKSKYPQYKNNVCINYKFIPNNTIDVKGPNIDVKGSDITPTGHSLVMDYLDISLEKFIKKHNKYKGGDFFCFTHHTIIKIMKDTIQGLIFLHANNIAHSDIKADNIMIRCVKEDCNEMINAVIVDYGLSCYYVEGICDDVIPSPMCLNRIKCEEKSYRNQGLVSRRASLSEKTHHMRKNNDVYALGLVFYHVMHGLRLINIRSYPITEERLCKIAKNISHNEEISQDDIDWYNEKVAKLNMFDETQFNEIKDMYSGYIVPPEEGSVYKKLLDVVWDMIGRMSIIFGMDPPGDSVDYLIAINEKIKLIEQELDHIVHDKKKCHYVLEGDMLFYEHGKKVRIEPPNDNKTQKDASVITLSPFELIGGSSGAKNMYSHNKAMYIILRDEYD